MRIIKNSEKIELASPNINTSIKYNNKNTHTTLNARRKDNIDSLTILSPDKRRKPPFITCRNTKKKKETKKKEKEKEENYFALCSTKSSFDQIKEKLFKLSKEKKLKLIQMDNMNFLCNSIDGEILYQLS